MDFGVMGFLDNNLLCSNNNDNVGFTLEQENGNDEDKQQQQQQQQEKCCGSRRSALLANHDGGGGDAGVSCFRDFKVAKTTSNISSSSCGETMLKIPLLQRSSNGGSEGQQQQQMLSFTSPTATLPYYHHSASNAAAFFSRNTGYGSGVINGGSCMQGPGVLKGPFTPSQWMELEHQALIYKYITANVPIPSYLLNPIKKAFESAGFSVLRSGAWWGGFQLGFGSNSDPEPGRCRRTDGKKWRCSRDAVADQKYCERHMNRGRHRSRKPVEAQQSAAGAAVGHSATTTTTTTLNNAKPPAPPTTSSSSTLSTGSLGLLHQHQFSNLHHPGVSTNHHLSGIPKSNRSHENTDVMHQHTRAVSTASSPKVSSPKEGHQSITKPLNPEFGLVCSDSLLNPLVNIRNYDHYHNLNNPPENNKSQHHALLQFMDDWPKSQPDRTSWSDSIGLQPDRTELSISIPVAASPPASPLRLSREADMGPITNQRQTNWAWEPSSVGGPLGEVLHNTSSTTSEYCNTGKAALNLMEMWDNTNRPHLASSPTGVLQRGAFGSLSNSSTGSSPRADSHGLIGTGFMNPSLPAL